MNKFITQRICLQQLKPAKHYVQRASFWQEVTAQGTKYFDKSKERHNTTVPQLAMGYTSGMKHTLKHALVIRASVKSHRRNCEQPGERSHNLRRCIVEKQHETDKGQAVQKGLTLVLTRYVCNIMQNDTLFLMETDTRNGKTSHVQNP